MSQRFFYQYAARNLCASEGKIVSCMTLKNNWILLDFLVITAYKLSSPAVSN